MIRRNLDFFVVFFILLAMLAINRMPNPWTLGTQKFRPAVTVVRLDDNR